MKGAASTVPRYAIPNYFTNPVIRPYLANVRNWQCYIRFLGLPDRRDNPDILIDRLFVTPLLARRYVSPDENPENWTDEAETLLDALAEHSPLVLLGDPGIGKSTFLNYVAWLFSRPAENALIDRMGWRLPLPMVLRELPVSGVTDFNGLLEAFLGREMSAPLREDDGRYLRQALAEGQAFVLLDGIDELGDRTARENLRSAVFDGMARYPDSRWLLTSRIVGYDEVPFDTERSQSGEEWLSKERNEEIVIATGETYVTRNEIEDIYETEETREEFFEKSIRESNRVRRESVAGKVTTRYIAPFDDRRIMAFARNWYVRREASASRANANADHLVRAVHADESILRLARVPNLLTMMALIHRIEATLPHGRALLYERIAEAYLESIDKFRGIESSPHDLPRKKVWLARVGFEMQCGVGHGGRPVGWNQRSHGCRPRSRSWLSEEMGRSDATPDTPSAEEFLKIVGRRSGLFLPRGEGLYAFVHLSFQEYFAAVALKREVTRLRWAKGHASKLGFRRATLAGWAGESLWRETFAFLFELLASEEDDDWHADLLDCVFGEEFSRLNGSESDEVTLNLGYLLARLIVNSRSGLPPLRRDEAIEFCVRVQFRVGFLANKMSSTIFSHLVGEDSWLNAKAFEQIGTQMQKIPLERRKLDLRGAHLLDLKPLEELPSFLSLDLVGTQVSDLRPLAKLPALQTLDLADTQVSDLEPLAKLTALERLNLVDTPVSDLEPLAKLTELQFLYFGGTRVLDLTPLASLAALRSLAFWQTEVSDLDPLANLTMLRILIFGGTQVLDLTPLAGLGALEQLSLWYTDVSNFEPLINLAGLKSLDIAGTLASDLGPLADLTAIQNLDLEGTQVADLGPLVGLVSLRKLQLGGTPVSDIGPLENLTALEHLSLESTQVSEIRPLANLATLKWLDLRQTRVSAAAIEDLRTLRPGINILHQN